MNASWMSIFEAIPCSNVLAADDRVTKSNQQNLSWLIFCFSCSYNSSHLHIPFLLYHIPYHALCREGKMGKRPWIELEKGRKINWVSSERTRTSYKQNQPSSWSQMRATLFAHLLKLYFGYCAIWVTFFACVIHDGPYGIINSIRLVIIPWSWNTMVHI